MLAKTVQWKACSRGHVFLGTRGCPACERANALRPKSQQTQRSDRHLGGWTPPSERPANGIVRTLVTLRPPA